MNGLGKKRDTDEEPYPDPGRAGQRPAKVGNSMLSYRLPTEGDWMTTAHDQYFAARNRSQARERS